MTIKQMVKELWYIAYYQNFTEDDASVISSELLALVLKTTKNKIPKEFFQELEFLREAIININESISISLCGMFKECGEGNHLKGFKEKTMNRLENLLKALLKMNTKEMLTEEKQEKFTKASAIIKQIEYLDEQWELVYKAPWYNKKKAPSKVIKFLLDQARLQKDNVFSQLGEI